MGDLPLRLSLLTLGVENLDRSAAFYAALGLSRSDEASNASVAFFQAGGAVLALFGRKELAAECGVDAAGSGFRGVTLAWNVPNEEAVEMALARVAEAGGTVTRPAGRAFWGGYVGCFADPDGHLWEVAYNPFFPLAEDGTVTLP